MAVLDLDLDPPRKALRTFGVAAAAVAAAFATLGSPPDAVRVSLLAVAGLCLLLAVAAPPLLRPLYVVLMVLVFPIGLVVSYAVLGLIFFGLLTPLGLVFRLFGRDSLGRRWEPSAATYWVSRGPTTRPERYFRQF
jgi:hypothetical protein